MEAVNAANEAKAVSHFTCILLRIYLSILQGSMCEISDGGVGV